MSSEHQVSSVARMKRSGMRDSAAFGPRIALRFIRATDTGASKTEAARIAPRRFTVPLRKPGLAH